MLPTGSPRPNAVWPAPAIAIAAALLLGVFFRFYALPAHGFWGDEGVTALRAAGYAKRDVIHLLSGTRPVTAASVVALRRVGSRGPHYVIASLAAEDAVHPPVYYVLAQLWERAVGSGAVPLRLLTALLSLLFLPSMYWLAWELFASRLAALLCTALAAISPFFVEYAQQAREYTLWAVFACVGSALLLRMLRTRAAGWAIAYAVVSAAGLYVDTLYVLILAAHAVYAVLERRSFGSGRLRVFALAAGVALLVFSPWSYFIARDYLQHAYGAYQSQSTIAGIAYTWSVALAAPITDLEMLRLWFFPIAAGAVALEILAVSVLIRQTPRRIWLLVCTLIGTFIMLQAAKSGLTDMVRYWTASIVGVELALGWFFASALENANRTWAGGAAALLCVLVVLCGYDDVLRAQRVVWWTNDYGAPLPPIAARIDTPPGAANALVLGSPRDDIALEDLTALLEPGDLVWSPSPRVLAENLDRWRGRRVFIFTRFRRLEPAIAGGFAVEAIPVKFPARGYDLVALAKQRRTGHKLETTWLWRLEPRRL